MAPNTIHPVVNYQSDIQFFEKEYSLLA